MNVIPSFPSKLPRGTEARSQGPGVHSGHRNALSARCLAPAVLTPAGTPTPPRMTTRTYPHPGEHPHGQSPQAHAACTQTQSSTRCAGHPGLPAPQSFLAPSVSALGPPQPPSRLPGAPGPCRELRRFGSRWASPTPFPWSWGCTRERTEPGPPKRLPAGSIPWSDGGGAMAQGPWPGLGEGAGRVLEEQVLGEKGSSWASMLLAPARWIPGLRPNPDARANSFSWNTGWGPVT